MSRRKDEGKSPAFWLLRLGGAILSGGALLFFYVWWPIQAERSLKELKVVESTLSDKKQELQDLSMRTTTLTSLSVLDAWAKKNGPWKTPGAADVVAIEY